ncbi:hypothetical protein [Intrasporangium flavum]|uniref:hypothetical protein n=1 Tax=Intrasporangium flavum TaxID=1428657 RepID=UPI00096F4423|nr:hypothetical protein [Intrasporangium flavum]
MSLRTDTPSPATPTGPRPTRIGRFAAGLLLVGAALVVVALGFQGQDLAVVFYAGFALVATGGVVAVVHHLRTAGGPVTVLPTSRLGWVAVAMLVVGVVASAVAPLVEVGSRHASAVQNLAVQGGFVLAGLSGLMVLLAAWRQRERSLPAIVLCGLAGLAFLLLLFGVETQA